MRDYDEGHPASDRHGREKTLKRFEPARGSTDTDYVKAVLSIFRYCSGVASSSHLGDFAIGGFSGFFQDFLLFLTTMAIKRESQVGYIVMLVESFRKQETVSCVLLRLLPMIDLDTARQVQRYIPYAPYYNPVMSALQHRSGQTQEPLAGRLS